MERWNPGSSYSNIIPDVTLRFYVIGEGNRPCRCLAHGLEGVHMGVYMCVSVQSVVTC